MSDGLTFPDEWAHGAVSTKAGHFPDVGEAVAEIVGAFLRAFRPIPQNIGPDLTRASDVAVEKVDYIWHDRFVKGAIAVIGGPSGKGKSLCTTKIAADVSTGRGMPDRSPAAVIFSNMEDARSISRGRIEVAGGDLDNVYFRHYTIPEDVSELEADINTLGAKLVILDTASKHVSAPIRNDQKVAQALTPLQAMCERTGVTVIFVTHTLKHVGRNTDPLLAIGGAVGGLVGSARCVALFGVHPSNPDHRALSWVKNSYGETPKGIVFGIESEPLYDDRGFVMATAGALVIEDDDADVDALALVTSRPAEDGASVPTEKRAAAAEWLTSVLANGPVAVADLKIEAENEGHSWGTIRRAEEGIGIEKPRDGFGKGSTVFWRLPDDHPALNVPATQNRTPGGK